MNSGQKNFHKLFAGVSLGFSLLAALLLPFPIQASPNTNGNKREAASSQFSHAEELRSALNEKPAEKRTLAEYKQVVTSYRRVSLITPRAPEVPESLFIVGELNTEMGSRYGRSYYQAAVDSYSFLMREYPTSKFVQDAMLQAGFLQKDQLGDPNGATKTFQDLLKKYPKTTHKREVQEALAELALLRNAESGNLAADAKKETAPAATPAAPPAAVREDVAAVRGGAKNGGEVSEDGIPRVQTIRTGLTPDSTEIVIELEGDVQYVSGRIANPDRIYFDLHAAKLTPAVARNNVPVSGELLTKVRVAQNQSGVVRVVLDVNGVQDYSAALLRNPTRLLIELYADKVPGKREPVQTASAHTKAESAPAPKTQAPPKPLDVSSANAKPLPVETVVVPAKAPDSVAGKGSPSSKGMIVADPTAPAAPATPAPAALKQELPPPSKTLRTASSTTKTAAGTHKPDLVQPTSAPQPTRDGQSTLTRALGLKIGRIVIDAGHGGHDTGTIGPTGLMEKDLCLDVALRLGKLIQQKLPTAEIVYTRSDDTFIPLEERTQIANDAKADLFVSIHANSSPDHAARGVETYYLNLKGSAEAMEVAARENAVAQGNIHDLEDMVKKIARTEKIDESRELAEDIQDSLSKRLQKTAKPVKNRGVRKAPFVVLIGADMPSILTEISFLSNPADEQLLKKPEHRQRIAEGVYQGMESYLQSMNSMNVNLYTKPSRGPAVTPVEQSRNQK